MIRRVLFYLNRSKPTVFDAVSHGAALCRARGVQPCFLAEDAPALHGSVPEALRDAIVLDS